MFKNSVLIDKDFDIEFKLCIYMFKFILFVIILYRKFSFLDVIYIYNELFYKRCLYSLIEKGLVFFFLYLIVVYWYVYVCLMFKFFVNIF